MESINITTKKLDTLPRLHLHDIEHDESDLYKYSADILIKIFKNSNKDYLKDKMKIINELLYLKKYIEFKSLVFPNYYININNGSKGYAMDYIHNNINGKILLNSDKISIEEQIRFLKEIYEVLNRIESNDILKKNNYHLSDIHEANFILNRNDNRLHVVDIDSSYIDGVIPQKSKFLTLNDKLYNNFETKYPYNDDYIHIPNYNTTIISYIYILLNYLTKEYSPNFNKNDFCEILNIMLSVGFEKELCDAIFNIYKVDDNYFDFDYINAITPKLVLDFRKKYAKK